MTIWSQGYRYHKPTAVAVRTSDGQRSIRMGEPELSVVASLRDGWLAGADDLIVLTADGDQVPVRESSQTARPQRGDVAAGIGPNGPRLYRPDENTAYQVRVPGGSSRGFVVTTDGALVTLTDRDGIPTVVRTSMESSTSVDLGASDRRITAGWLTGYDNRLIAYTTYHPAPLGDGQEDPLYSISISTDGGLHWRTARAPKDLSVVLSMAVTQDTGFLTVGAGSCSLVRLPPRAPAGCVRKQQSIQTFARGRRVYTTFFHGHHFTLRTSGTNGRTWQRIPAPGREQ